MLTFFPSFKSSFLPRAEGKPPPIRLLAVILVDGDGFGVGGTVSFEYHTLLAPSVFGTIHVCAEKKSPSSIGLALVLMELIDGDCFMVIIVYGVKSDAFVEPSIA
jgi:hypothetical protein